MNGITKQKAKIKNLIGVVDDPKEEDLLFEIVYFLEKENRLDEEFTKHEVTLKTRCRLGDTVEEDLRSLVASGYLGHRGWYKFKVLKHPW